MLIFASAEHSMMVVLVENSNLGAIPWEKEQRQIFAPQRHEFARIILKVSHCCFFFIFLCTFLCYCGQENLIMTVNEKVSEEIL